MIRGKFQAQDDLDLAGHRFLNWNWLNDIPSSDAEAGQVIVFDGSEVVWTSVKGIGSAGPLYAGTGISLSANVGTVTISSDLEANELGGTGYVDSQFPVWESASGQFVATTYSTTPTDNMRRFSVNFLIDGVGAYISNGNKGYVRLPVDCALERVSAFAEKVCTLAFEIDTANYTNHHTNYTDLTGGSDLTMSTANKVSNTTLTAWTTDLDRGDLLRFTVTTTNTTATLATIVMDFIKD